MSQKEKLNQWYNILIPRLRHIENTGNASTIHDVRQYIGRLIAYHAFVNDDNPKFLENMDDYLQSLEKNLFSAEEYLVSLTRRKP